MSLQDPLVYRLRDIRDYGLSESFHELPNLFEALPFWPAKNVPITGNPTRLVRQKWICA
jgi:hypothetical protein